MSVRYTLDIHMQLGYHHHYYYDYDYDYDHDPKGKEEKTKTSGSISTFQHDVTSLDLSWNLKRGINGMWGVIN